MNNPEILATLGMQNTRPKRMSNTDPTIKPQMPLGQFHTSTYTNILTVMVG